jgi:hypothetical protein
MSLAATLLVRPVCPQGQPTATLARPMPNYLERHLQHASVRLGLPRSRTPRNAWRLGVMTAVRPAVVARWRVSVRPVGQTQRWQGLRRTAVSV